MKLAPILFITLFFVSCQSKKDKLIQEIKVGETKLFNDSIKMPDPIVATDVYNKYVEFADTYKEDTLSADYLFKAGDLANGLHKPQESVKLFQRLRENYPDYRKSAVSLFMEGFIYETALNDKEKAKTLYAEFIRKYPGHQLTPSAQASLDQLNSNLTDEELIRKFEAMQAK